MGFEMTLADLESLIDEDVVAHGAALCVGHALASEGPLPERLRFDVVSVRVNLDAGRSHAERFALSREHDCLTSISTPRYVRVHHVRGAWQS